MAGALAPRKTPLLPVGGVLLKLENLQRTGSFKLRGALAQLEALGPKERRRGVLAASAGNHGAGLALAGSALGVPVTVYVPEATPQNKREKIAALGARVIVEGQSYDESDAIARRRAEELGAVFASPFDDDDVIAGNGGGLAEELLSQVPDLAQVVVPVGGGGLIAGLAQTLSPRGVSVLGVQPRANCAMHDSLRAGRAHTSYRGNETMAEGCEGAVSERTYRICADHGVEVALVSEEAIRAALVYLYREAGQIAEPSGAVAVAGWREGVSSPAERGSTVLVVTGGNVEPALLDELLVT